MNHYVYVYLDTRKPGKYIYDDLEFDYEPFYVGKGSKRRCFDGIKRGSAYKMNKIHSIKKCGYEPKILKVHENLDINESFKLEIELILKIGRHDLEKGPLVNLTDGGEGRVSFTISDETRKKMSLASFGRKHSDESKRKIGLAHLGSLHSDESKIKISMAGKGRKLSEEAKIKIGLSSLGNKYSLGKTHSEETKRKLSELKSGENHPMYGKKHKIETIKKMSAAKIGKFPSNKGIPCSKETKEKISNSLKGDKNFNYGKHFDDEHRRKLSESNKTPQIKPVCQYDLNNNFIKEYDSILSASIENSINNTSIGKCCRGLNNKAGNYKWEFKYKDGNHRKNNNKIC